MLSDKDTLSSTISGRPEAMRIVMPLTSSQVHTSAKAYFGSDGSFPSNYCENIRACSAAHCGGCRPAVLTADQHGKGRNPIGDRSLLGSTRSFESGPRFRSAFRRNEHHAQLRGLGVSSRSGPMVFRADACLRLEHRKSLGRDSRRCDQRRTAGRAGLRKDLHHRQPCDRLTSFAVCDDASQFDSSRLVRTK